MNPWIDANVLTVKKWTNSLFSLILQAPIVPFYAGQFTKLAMYDPITLNKIQRAYSYVNAPSAKNLEIYINRIVNGKFSNLLYQLQSGDKIFIKKKSFGFFILNEIPDCEILWMFATGTAIGPYCSILQENKNTERFHHIVLVHAVRYYNELSYLPLMNILKKKYHGKLKIQTIVSREEHKNSLTGRIPNLLKNQNLEKSVGLSINTKNSHVMLCGNPDMVQDTYVFLKNYKNMEKNLRRKPGNITMERYW